MPIYISNVGKGEKEVASLLEMRKIPVVLQHIDSGDFVFNDIAIERKTISDLTFSVIGKNRHLWNQLKVMKDTYKKTLLIIEGNINYKDKLLSSILDSIVVGWQIPFLPSANVYETATIISNLFSRYGCSKTNSVPPAGVRKCKTVKDIQLEMLQTIYGIGVEKAKEILKHNPKIFSMNKYTYDLNIKGLRETSKELLINVLTNE